MSSNKTWTMHLDFFGFTRTFLFEGGAWPPRVWETPLLRALEAVTDQAPDTLGFQRLPFQLVKWEGSHAWYAYKGAATFTPQGGAPQEVTQD